MLRTGKARTLGVLGANPSFFSSRGSFVGEIMHGLMQAGVDAGYHICLLTGWEHVTEGNEAHADLGTADGLLVLNRDLYHHAAHVEALRRFRLPIVYALEYPDESEAWWTAPHDEQGGKLAVSHLVQAGHKHIAFVKSPIYPGIFGRRQHGWAEGMRACGLTPDTVIEIADAQASRAVLQSPATAFVCANETIATWCKHACDAANAHRDLVSFSYLQNGEKPSSSIPQVHHALAQTIAAAVGQLIARIEGKATTRHIQTPYSFSGTLRGP
jgi:LacI family transcriptional regulator